VKKNLLNNHLLSTSVISLMVH